MQKLIIVAALVACSLAAPIENIKETFQTVDLARPSPINPDIPSEPKPEEKVTLITDAEEQPLQEAKAVPQPSKLPGPYVPLSDSLSRSKRADKDSSESEENSSEEDKKPSIPLHPHPPSTLLERLAARTSTTEASAPASSTDTTTSDGTTSDANTSSTATAPRKPYAPLIHQHNEHRFRPTTEAADSSADSSTSSTTAAPSVVASNNHVNDKRDIPVPLTRKYHHDDDATKQKEEPDTADDVPEEEVKQEEEKDEDHKPAVPAAHPATITRPIPVAELFAKKPPSTE